MYPFVLLFIYIKMKGQGKMSFDFSQFMKNPREQQSKEEIPEIAEPLKDNNMSRTIAYLTQARKLSMEILRPLIDAGKLEQTLFQGTDKETGKPYFKPYATFKIYDDKNRLVCLEKISPNTYVKDKKIEGNSSHFGFEVVRGKGENAMFFESTIDMLSYMELFNQSLDNHRLVSIMGCKHNIIEETVRRNNIDENKIYICSDADNAGDNLYDKVKQTFPDAKRIRCKGEFYDKRHVIEEKETVDKNGASKKIAIDTGQIAQYKDWNDMLKDFKENNLTIRFNEKGNTSVVRVSPQRQQQVVFRQPQQLYPQHIKQQTLQQPKALNKLIVFGNKMWNDATDKNDKIILSIPSKAYESIDKALKSSCINFYAYTRQHDNGYTVAINSRDLEWFNRIAKIGNPDFNPYEVNISKPSKETEITDVFKAENSQLANLKMEQIKGFTIGIDTSLKIAEICSKENIDFFLQIYPERNSSQLRINIDDTEKIKEIYQRITTAREQFGFNANQVQQQQPTVVKEQIAEKEEEKGDKDSIDITD